MSDMIPSTAKRMSSLYSAVKTPMMPNDALKNKVALVTGGATGMKVFSLSTIFNHKTIHP